MNPAITLLELDSVAFGIRTGDAMAKRAPLTTLHAGSVQPGKYLVLAGGQVAEVQEALLAGRLAAGRHLLDEIFLSDVHPAVVAALTGATGSGTPEALGIVETRTVAATIGAADAGVKGANVDILRISMADGLGGRAYVLFAGTVAEVEAAVAQAGASLREPGMAIGEVVIPRLDEEMLRNLLAGGEFGPLVRRYGESRSQKG